MNERCKVGMGNDGHCLEKPISAFGYCAAHHAEHVFQKPHAQRLALEQDGERQRLDRDDRDAAEKLARDAAEK